LWPSPAYTITAGVETSRQPPASLKIRWTTDILGSLVLGTLPVQLELAGPNVDDCRRVPEAPESAGSVDAEVAQPGHPEVGKAILCRRGGVVAVAVLV